MSKFWKILVVILALLNVGLLAAIWFRPMGGHMGRGHEHEGMGAFNMIVDKLKMTDAQVKAYEQLRNNHHDSMLLLQDEGGKLRQSLFSNLKNGAGVQPAADSLMNLIAANQKMIEGVTYRHFAQVRSICTDEQQQKFDEIIGEVIKMMSAQGHGPHNSHEGPPPHDEQEGPPDDRMPPPQ